MAVGVVGVAGVLFESVFWCWCRRRCVMAHRMLTCKLRMGDGLKRGILFSCRAEHLPRVLV